MSETDKKVSERNKKDTKMFLAVCVCVWGGGGEVKISEKMEVFYA